MIPLQLLIVIVISCSILVINGNIDAGYSAFLGSVIVAVTNIWFFRQMARVYRHGSRQKNQQLDVPDSTTVFAAYYKAQIIRYILASALIGTVLFISKQQGQVESFQNLLDKTVTLELTAFFIGFVLSALISIPLTNHQLRKVADKF